MWQWTYPMALMVFYIWGIGVFNFITRFGAVKNGKVSREYFRNLDSAKNNVPEFVVRLGRHYDNQFALPLLFLITGILCIHLDLFGLVEAICAWGFVLSRFLHGYVHLGSNHVLKRAGAFALGWLFIMVLWVLIALQTMPMP